MMPGDRSPRSTCRARAFTSWQKSLGLPVLVALLAAAISAFAQPTAERSIELDGETLRFSVRTFAPDAHFSDPAAVLEPVSALNTAKLLGRFLAAGASEDAAMLSNAPRRRFEVLREYQASVGDEGFRKVFAEYFEPGNRVVAELAMGEHSLLVWHLREANRYSGQFYVRVEGKELMDDVPSQERVRLRRLLEAVRTGQLPLPAQ